jgi:hypothetical protein
MNSLKLSFGGISVLLNKFAPGNYPRERPTYQISRTAYGAINRRGSAQEEPFLWQVDTIVNKTDRDNLLDLHNAYSQNPGPIVLDDLVSFFSEPVRTRALAEGSPAAITVNGRIRYFARFNVEIEGTMSVLGLGGGYYRVGFQLVETSKVLA